MLPRGLTRRSGEATANGPRDRTSAPDYVEPVLGWRLWHVVEESGALRLRSLFHPFVWPARESVVARCLRVRIVPWPARSGGHEAPRARCECGVYASDLETALDYLLQPPPPGVDGLQRVLGLVSLWGSVIECEHGWRASHAYPSTLYVPTRAFGARPRLSPREIAAGLGSSYGIPTYVVPVDHPADLVQLMTHEPVEVGGVHSRGGES